MLFVQYGIHLLGYVVSASGVTVDPARIKAIYSMPAPKTFSELRSFLGLAGYYWRFIRGFAKKSGALHAGTSSQKQFSWTGEMMDSFTSPKPGLTSPPVLAYPDFDRAFVVETDASSYAVDTVRAQKDKDGKTYPVQFSAGR